MTRCRDMDKKLKKYQKTGSSPIFEPQRFFFKIRALSFLYPYGALASCKKNYEKLMNILWDKLKDKLKGEQMGGWMDGQSWLHITP